MNIWHNIGLENVFLRAPKPAWKNLDKGLDIYSIMSK